MIILFLFENASKCITWFLLFQIIGLTFYEVIGIKHTSYIWVSDPGHYILMALTYISPELKVETQHFIHDDLHSFLNS